MVVWVQLVVVPRNLSPTPNKHTTLTPSITVMSRSLAVIHLVAF